VFRSAHRLDLILDLNLKLVCSWKATKDGAFEGANLCLKEEKWRVTCIMIEKYTQKNALSF